MHTDFHLLVSRAIPVRRRLSKFGKIRRVSNARGEYLANTEESRRSRRLTTSSIRQCIPGSFVITTHRASITDTRSNIFNKRFILQSRS